MTREEINTWYWGFWALYVVTLTIAEPYFDLFIVQLVLWYWLTKIYRERLYSAHNV